MPRAVPPTLTDYAVTAVSPVLIISMIASLVFFLIEVLYAGRYSDRLVWTMFFFTVGTVFIARIMILHGANRALLYAAGLAAATFLALQAFVDYPNLTMRSFTALINAALMALIWWSANKLTWDCTHIDEDRKNAGRGVLDAARDTRVDEPEPPKKKDAPGLLGWVARFNRHQEAQAKKAHTPGVWVLYFSLASLPLFGIGQSLIPVDDVARRRAVFTQMAVYVGSGLGLLATTTLLGLRKYLRDRGANIPVKMTAGWLAMAAALVLAFLVVAAFLPRPHSETPLVNLPKFAKSKDRDAKKNAPLKDGSHGEKDGAKGKQEHDPNAKDQAKGENGEDDKNGEKSDKGSGKDETSNPSGSGKDEKSEKSGSGDEKTKSERRGFRDEEKSESQSGETNQAASEPPKIAAAMEKVGSIIKWIAWAIVVLLVLAAIAIFILRYLAPFTQWAKGLLDWLNNLFGRKQAVEKEDARPETKPQPRPPAFRTFADPTGQMPLSEQLEYSFRALESWAFENDTPREPEETPIEFADRLTQQGLDARPLARCYSQSLYSAAELDRSSRESVRQFWQSVG